MVVAVIASVVELGCSEGILLRFVDMFYVTRQSITVGDSVLFFSCNEMGGLMKHLCWVGFGRSTQSGFTVGVG